MRVVGVVGVVRVVGVVGVVRVVGLVGVVRVVRVGGRAIQLLRIKKYSRYQCSLRSVQTLTIYSPFQEHLILLDQFAISSEFKVSHEYIRSALIFLIPVEITKAKGKYPRPCHSFVEQIDVTFCGKIEEI